MWRWASGAESVPLGAPSTKCIGGCVEHERTPAQGCLDASSTFKAQAMTGRPHNPAVTVAMAAFNAEKTISAAVGSLVIQSLQDWELLFFDDGSTDATADIVARFNDPRIVIFADGEKRGLAIRLNQAIESARPLYRTHGR
jgi:cellulose synthase/poly-beta-1,6-N-acetylglucosamine synthase-like glycosyltransferase